tara:strand:+ start:2204 stop:2686 length:483 start_codon:yes stop_codon:yes gene_type:complete
MSYLVDSKKIQNFTHNVDASFSQEDISTTVEYFPGTEVTYTPTSGASKVIYECDFQVSWNPDARGSYIYGRLQESTDGGSSWSTISGTYASDGTFSAASDYDWFQVRYIFVINSWSGSKKLRIVGRTSSTSQEFTIGRSWNASGSEGSDAPPHVSICSVM